VTEPQRTAVIFGGQQTQHRLGHRAKLQQSPVGVWPSTYQNERLEQEAKDLITDLPGASGFMCDVSSDEQIAKLFDKLKSKYGELARLGPQRGVCACRRHEGEFINTRAKVFASPTT